MFVCKDELIDTYDQYFEQGKKHVDFLYFDLDLSQMGSYKIIRDDYFVDEKEGLLLKAIDPSIERGCSS